ncbi:MAG: hypothetical protein QXI10_00195 [Candidatus Diapherotrites archaeon]
MSKPFSEKYFFVKSAEKNQIAVLSLFDGKQNMFIGISPGELKGEKAVWIFPVPSKPENVEIGVVKKFPVLAGSSLKKMKNDAAFSILFWNSIFSLTPFPLSMLSFLISQPNYFGSSVFNPIKSPVRDSYVVYSSVSELGLRTELVSTFSSDGFANYSKDRGLNIEADVLKVFENYYGKDYSFVVSWIENPDVFYNEKSDECIVINDPVNRYKCLELADWANIIGVFVKFPTDKLYFPLIPTSVYGSTIVPAKVYVLGNVTPNIPDSIKQFTNVDYFVDTISLNEVEPELENLFSGLSQSGTAKKVEYTLVSINSPSYNFTDDLWFENKEPANISNTKLIINLISNNSIFFFLLFFILFSIVSSVLAAIIVFRRDVNLLKFALLGVSNIFSFVVFVIASFFFNVDKYVPKANKEPKDFVKPLLFTSFFVLAGIILFFLILLFPRGVFIGFDYATTFLINALFFVGFVILYFLPFLLSVYLILFFYFNNRKELAKFFVLFFAFFAFLNLLLFFTLTNII